MKTFWVLAGIGMALSVSGTALADDGAYCREYQKKVTIGGVVQNSYGTACMQPDGSWQIEGQQVQGPSDLDGDMTVADVEPMGQPVYVQQVVYEQPEYRYVGRPYYQPWPVGVNLAWTSGDWGRGRGGDWHGGRGHEHGGGHGRH